MRITTLDLYHVVVPLRRPFRHATQVRDTSENFLVRVTLDNGMTGYGEGVPREYVTGETVTGCFQRVRSGADPLGGIGWGSFNQVVEWLWDWNEQATGEQARAWRCAVELALLDAAGKTWGKRLGDVFEVLPDVRGLCEPREEVRYSAVAGMDKADKVWKTGLKFRLYGFRQVKVKVGVDQEADGRRLLTLRRVLGRNVELRVDANGSWTTAQAPARMKQMATLGVTSVEQPLSRQDGPGLTELKRVSRVPIVLDESLVSLEDAMTAVAGKWGDVFNVRLAKCGGFLACVKLTDLARRSGWSVQLGCHPGETGILSAAGREFASTLTGLRSQEGSYDRHLLGANIIQGDVTFGYGGKAHRLPGHGLGVTVDPRKLDALTVNKETISY